MKPAVYLYGVPGQYENYLGGTGERRGPGGPVPGPVPQSGLRGTAAARRRGHPGPPSGNGVLSDRLLCPVPAAHSGDLPGTPGPERPLGRDPAGYPRPPAAPGRSGAPHPGGGADGPSAGGSSRRHQLPPPGGGPPGPALTGGAVVPGRRGGGVGPPAAARCWGSSGTRSARAMACAGRTPPGQRPCLPISLH